MRTYKKHIIIWMLIFTLILPTINGCNKTPDDADSSGISGEDGISQENTDISDNRVTSSAEGSDIGDSDSADDETSDSGEIVSAGDSTGQNGSTTDNKPSPTSGESRNSQDALKETEKYSSDNLPNVDLKKFVFKIGTSDKGLIKNIYDADDDKADSITANHRLRYSVISEIEKRFNCVVEVIHHEYGKTSEVYTPSILSGASASVPHVILTSTWEAGNLMVGNLLTDFDQLQYIDASKPWWNYTMAQASKIKGKTYLMSSEICWPSQRAWMVGYNKDIASGVGLTPQIIKDLVEKKEWTWDKFISYAKKAVKDTNGDGKLDEKDRWGFSAPATDFTYAMMASAGIGFVDNVGGEKKYALNNSKAISALEKLNKIMTSEGIRYPVENNTTQLGVFAEGQSLFFFYTAGGVLSNIRKVGNMGLLPIPLGPGEKNYVSLIDHNSPSIAIPKTNKNLRETALLLEALSFKYWKNLPEIVENFKELNLDEGDKLSADILHSNHNYMTVSMSQFNNTQGYSQQVLQPILRAVLTPNEDVSGVVISIRNAAQANIDLFYGQ